jgi:hypothetical protein
VAISKKDTRFGPKLKFVETKEAQQWVTFATKYIQLLIIWFFFKEFEEGADIVQDGCWEPID